MKVTFESLYEHIGYLFYALASEFHKLSSYEDSKLNELIEEHWKVLHPKDAPLHHHLNEHLHTGVHNAMTASLLPDQAFKIFEDYYLVHKRSFGDTLRDKIQKCSDQIVHDYYTARCDSKLITQLKSLLRSQHPYSLSVPSHN
jgi:hypothetical protein